MDIRNLSQRVFHVYYRANDRREIFIEHDNYVVFLRKMHKKLTPVAHLIAYCIMPNHFHLLLIPKHELRENIVLNGKANNFMPTAELSEATRTWLMGFTKSYNKHFNLTGSRFQPHGKAKHHDGNLKFGVDYLHQNPVRANLVSHPSEWGYSSYNEYYFQEDPADCFCDRDLGRQLLALYP